MILPIVAFGDPVLKKKAQEVDVDYEGLSELIEHMFETMYAAQGVGLAAPQIGLSLRLFIVDASPFGDDVEDPEAAKVKDFKEVFINAEITSRQGTKWPFQEGCLSIPAIREEIQREAEIEISYFDHTWTKHTKTFDGYAARIIQHEYDHIEGVLFIDHLNPLKKRMLKGKLSDISKGIVDANYRMKFYQQKKQKDKE